MFASLYKTNFMFHRRFPQLLAVSNMGWNSLRVSSLEGLAAQLRLHKAQTVVTSNAVFTLKMVSNIGVSRRSCEMFVALTRKCCLAVLLRQVSNRLQNNCLHSTTGDCRRRANSFVQVMGGCRLNTQLLVMLTGALRSCTC